MKTLTRILIATVFAAFFSIPYSYSQIHEQPVNTEVCIGDTTAIFITLQGYITNFQWQKNGFDIPGETDSIIHFDGATFQDSGYYNCILTNSSGTSYTDTVTLSVYQNPVVDLGSDVTIYSEDTLVLHAGPNYETYIWSNQTYDSTLILVPSSNMPGTHNYSVSVSLNGCVGSDDINITYDISCDIEPDSKREELILFPNPNNGNFTIRYSNEVKGAVKIKVFDIYGKQVEVITSDKYTNLFSEELHLSHLPVGCYIISVESQTYRTTRSFVKR